MFVAAGAVVVALIGNIMKEPLPGEHSTVAVFAEYCISAILFVGIMLNCIALMEILLRFIEYLFVLILKFDEFVKSLAVANRAQYYQYVTGATPVGGVLFTRLTNLLQK